MIVHDTKAFGPLDLSRSGLECVDTQLAEFVQHPSSGIFYIPSNRVFKVALLKCFISKDCRMKWNFLWCDGLDIYYSPFSGRVLPGFLRWRKKQLLKQLYGLNPIDTAPVNYRVPREFITNEWWIERNISARMRPEFNKSNWIDGAYTFPQRNFTDDYPRYSYSRFQERPPHLCRDLGEMFSDARFSIAYIPYTREYGIRIHGDIHEPNHYRPLRMRKIDFCPSCGTKFPPSLKARWQEEIRKSGRDPNDDGLPDKYLSDIWWKELGL